MNSLELYEKSDNDLSIAPAGLDKSFLDRWISFLDVSPQTLDTYTKSLKQFFAFLLEIGEGRPTRETILDFKEHLRKDHKPTTIQTYLAAVRLFFQWTDQEGIYPNIAAHVKGVRPSPGHKKDYLTSKQARQLLTSIDRSTVKGARDYALISLMLTTGLRTISVVRADVGDIRTVGDDVVLFHQGKGREEKASYVVLADHVDQAIREYLAKRKFREPADPLFASLSNHNKSGRLSTRSLRRIVKDRLRDISMDSDRLTAHSLRHTAATLNLLNGGSLEETRQLLDHSSINTTMIYSHALDRQKNTSEKRISKSIFGEE